jgi:hypothetical protein
MAQRSAPSKDGKVGVIAVSHSLRVLGKYGNQTLPGQSLVRESVRSDLIELGGLKVAKASVFSVLI